jgi:hypothetical protein
MNRSQIGFLIVTQAVAVVPMVGRGQTFENRTQTRLDPVMPFLAQENRAD